MRKRKKNIKEQRRKDLRFNQTWTPPQHFPFFGSASPRKIPHWFGCRQEIPAARAPLLLWLLTWGVTSPISPQSSCYVALTHTQRTRSDSLSLLFKREYFCNECFCLFSYWFTNSLLSDRAECGTKGCQWRECRCWNLNGRSVSYQY